MVKIIGDAEKSVRRYIAQGYWEPLLTSDYWDRNAEQYPDNEAIVDVRSRLNWMQIKQFSDRLALGFLDLGIKRDDIVICQLPNWADFLIVRLALLKAGILSCQPATTLRSEEMKYVLNQTQAVGVVIPWHFRNFDYFKMIQELQPGLPKLRHVLFAGDEAPEGSILLNEIYDQTLEEKYSPNTLQKTKFSPYEITHIGVTSGTTGKHKLVNQADAAIKLSAKDTISRAEITKNDVIACNAPLSGGAFNTLAFYCTPLAAAKIVLPEKFDAEESLKLIETEKVTVLSGVPTTLIRILNHPDLHKYDTSSLRLVFYSGAPIAYHTAVELEEKLGCRLMTRYGAFDIANLSCSSIHDTDSVRLLSAGKPYSGCEIKLFDDKGTEAAPEQGGEIWVRGATTTFGFYDDAKATDSIWNVPGKEGWGSTGDIGRFDNDGNLTIIGRKKEVIIRGGQNIYPVEIEDLLHTHQNVASVTVVSMPDPVMGERACAYVVVKPGQQFTFDEMLSFLRDKGIAPFKIPERLELVDNIPLVADQKVDKRRLEQDIKEKLKREGKL